MKVNTGALETFVQLDNSDVSKHLLLVIVTSAAAWLVLSPRLGFTFSLLRSHVHTCLVRGEPPLLLRLLNLLVPAVWPELRLHPLHQAHLNEHCCHFLRDFVFPPGDICRSCLGSCWRLSKLKLFANDLDDNVLIRSESYSPSLDSYAPYKSSVGTRHQCRGIEQGGQRGRNRGWWESRQRRTPWRQAAERWLAGPWRTSPRSQILCGVRFLAGTTWNSLCLKAIKHHSPDFGHRWLKPPPVGHCSWQVVVFTKLQHAGHKMTTNGGECTVTWGSLPCADRICSGSQHEPDGVPPSLSFICHNFSRIKEKRHTEVLKLMVGGQR